METIELNSKITKIKINENLNSINFYRQSDNIIFEEMPAPNYIQNIAPITNSAMNTVINSRQTLKNILDGLDHRFIMVVGPCSIHDPIAGFDYAKRLKKLADQLSDTLYIIMRVYFEKPRTNLGWKGFINDPCLDGSSCIKTGIRKARQFLLTINELELPVATELLDPNSLLYLNDLISWAAIGARTVESQPHRELASALDMPVGFKNNTNGSLDAAINGILAATNSHSFIGLNNNGDSSILRTSGNKYGHLVLRGGLTPNYDKLNVAVAEKKLDEGGLPRTIMVDCSHGNSLKNHQLQEFVLSDVVQQICDGNSSIIGAMLESNIEAGNQSIPSDVTKLQYGRSVTDACIDWETTERILRQTYKKLKQSVKAENHLMREVI